ncbi:MAG: 1-(5-phosphoribosyl)-5-[(5-phosphoribosylamino)methylideneamino]imidazole-4-carboxamide isomerase [Acidobacteriota bacterium]|nr:1-(5-phosphoribosyl)-5-[(5-phosphoribosylamino)methylideneamino]imidazole-4-carboxamide isomerase [Acidobacteriota bacterium]
MAILVVPAIDLRDGRCVRLTQGRKDNTTVYDGDPIEIARSYEVVGAQMIHVVDLDGAFANPNSRNREVLRKIISGITIPLQFGGGLRSLEDVAQVIELGVARVVIGTLAVESPTILDQALRLFGADRIAVGVDAKNEQVLTRGWEKEGKLSALDLAQKVASMGIERIIYTDVARDGMLTGVNVKQTCAIARESGLKVTASGGVSSLEDIKRLNDASECGIDSVIVGKALYEGRFSLKDAINEGSLTIKLRSLRPR